MELLCSTFSGYPGVVGLHACSTLKRCFMQVFNTAQRWFRVYFILYGLNFVNGLAVFLTDSVRSACGPSLGMLASAFQASLCAVPRRLSLMAIESKKPPRRCVLRRIVGHWMRGSRMYKGIPCIILCQYGASGTLLQIFTLLPSPGLLITRQLWTTSASHRIVRFSSASCILCAGARIRSVPQP